MRAALAERQVFVRRAGKVDAEGGVKGVCIAVAAEEPIQNLVALFHRLAMHVEIACGGAAEIDRRGGPADDLVGHGVIHSAGLDLRQKFGLVTLGMNPGGDGIAGRVIARRHHQTEQVAKLMVRHGGAIGAGGEDHVQDARCVARRSLSRHQILGIDI